MSTLPEILHQNARLSGENMPEVNPFMVNEGRFPNIDDWVKDIIAGGAVIGLGKSALYSTLPKINQATVNYFIEPVTNSLSFSEHVSSFVRATGFSGLLAFDVASLVSPYVVGYCLVIRGFAKLRDSRINQQSASYSLDK